MKSNFFRAVRVALRYRGTVAATLACSLGVALLWGGNIAAIFPVVKVVLEKQSLSDWVSLQVAADQTELAAFDTQIEQLDRELSTAAAERQDQIRSEKKTAEWDRDAAQFELDLFLAIQPFVDTYLPSEPFTTLVAVVLVLLASTFIKDVLLVLSAVLVGRLSQLTSFSLRKQFFRRTLRMELATFGHSGNSDLLNRFTQDVDSVGNGVQILFGRAVREPLKMIVCFGLAAWISWRLLLMTMVVAPIAAYLISRLAKTLKKANRRSMEQVSSLFGVLVETFGAIKVVKAFGMERHERLRFHHISKQCYRRSMRISLFNGMISPVTEMMGICTICVAILAGAHLVLSQGTHLLGIRLSARPLSVELLIVFFGALAGVSDPWRKLTEVFNRLQRANAASDRVYQMLDRKPAISDPPSPAPLVRPHRELVFDNVSFAYQSDSLVLEDINLTIPFGETVAIVGPNGCGKSTLANLIPRFFEPASGEVRLDQFKLSELRIRDLRGEIGLVTQEPMLFDDTVLNNIRYGARGASREAVIEAARRAHADSFIRDRLEDGYDTVVGSEGNRLSGGQRQRIALARAILRDPSILILDEATSQVDLESEQLILKVLEDFVRGRTTIIITHRPALLSLADRIVVMQAGRIVDIGPHAELMARCELYQRLYQAEWRESA